MTERELKLALPGHFVIPPLAREGDDLQVEPLTDLHLRATYFDTADLRLARSGVTLRHRTGETGGPRWTVKLPQGGSNGTAPARRELDLPGATREPPAEARSLVTAYARYEPLMAVATLRTHRRRWMLRSAGSEESLAELAIDEVSVIEGRHVVSRFRELDLDDLSGELPLDRLAAQLTAAGATGAEPIPKVVRALGSRATAPPDVRPRPMDDGATMADALRASIADALVRLVRHDPIARLGDAEAIHQVRVAFRRLRSDLRTLGDAVDSGWRDATDAWLREIAGGLAEARDLDVAMEHLAGDAGATDALRPLLDDLEQRRVAAQARVLGVLDTPEYPRLLETLVAATTEPPVGPAADRPAVEALPRLTLAAWERLATRARALSPTSPDDRFHRTRVAAKRARYAAELTARALPASRARGATRFAEKLAGLQTLLGTVQDAGVAESIIRASLERHGDTPGFAFEAGRAVERQQRRSTEARAAFPDAWKKLRRRRLRAWAQ